jgi:hypothetical protein
VHLEPSLIADHGQYMPIVAGHSVIGRDDDVSLRIPDQSVDRHHAELVRVGDGVRIVDLGSATGTFVNDEPVHFGAAATLRDGDVVRIGRTNLRFVGPDDPTQRHIGRSAAQVTTQPRTRDSSFYIRDQQADEINMVGRDQYHVIQQQRESFLREIAASRTRARRWIWIGFALVLIGLGAAAAAFAKLWAAADGDQATTPNQFAALLLAGAGVAVLGKLMMIIGVIRHIVATSRRRRVQDLIALSSPTRSA